MNSVHESTLRKPNQTKRLKKSYYGSKKKPSRKCQVSTTKKIVFKRVLYIIYTAMEVRMYAVNGDGDVVRGRHNAIGFKGREEGIESRYRVKCACWVVVICRWEAVQYYVHSRSVESSFIIAHTHPAPQPVVDTDGTAVVAPAEYAVLGRRAIPGHAHSTADRAAKVCHGMARPVVLSSRQLHQQPKWQQ